MRGRQRILLAIDHRVLSLKLLAHVGQNDAKKRYHGTVIDCLLNELVRWTMILPNGRSTNLLRNSGQALTCLIF
jgi:hypothetical protein